MNTYQEQTSVKSEKFISARGLVVEGAWDEMFNPIYLRLETFNERQFLIKMNRMGLRLLGKCGTVVDVIGTGSVDEKGRPWISVKRFEVPGYDEEYETENGLFVG